MANVTPKKNMATFTGKYPHIFFCLDTKAKHCLSSTLPLCGALWI